MTRKGSSPMGLELYLPILLAFVMLPLLTQAAPLQDYNEIQQYTEGCYYNYNHYNEGDRIMTNEPCLNCTCHNKMLMCYLRVCPFTKPIGNDCIVEKREDQCCPIITCPEVPVDVAHTAPEPGTGLSFPEKFGCSIEGKFYLEGAQVPSNPNKPCELCYCIKNRTSCLMQECTLHIDGCTPIYNRGSCCPVRYNCDHENEILELEDHSSTTEATTTTTTERPSTGFIITSTMTPAVSTVCVHNNEIYADGARIPGESACENCYCMRGDIVCAVQECHMPVLKDNGKLCHPLPATEGECCPSNYACEDDTSTTQILEATTLPYRVLDEDVKISPLDHSKDLYSSIPEEDLQLQIHINEEEIATKIPQTENVMGGRDPQAETDTKQVVAENEEKQDLEDEATTEYEPTTISAKDIKFVENTNPISSVTSSDNLPVTSTEIPGTTNYEHTEPNKKTDDDYSVQGGEEFVTKVSSAAEDLLEISTNTSRNGEEYTTVASVKGKPEFQESITDAPATDVESETSTELPIFGEEQTEGTTESAEEMKPIADMEYTTQVPSVNELVDDSNEMATKKPSASKNEYHIVEAATKLPEMELTSTIQILSIEQQNTLTTEANLKPFREQEGLEQKYGDLPTQYPSINVAEEAITNKVEEQESETEEENIDNTTQAPGKGLIEEEDLSVIEPIGDNEDLEGYEKERQDFATTVPNFSNEYERTTLSFDKQTSLYSAEATTEPDEDETSTKLPVSIHEEKPFIATAKAEEQTESSTDRVSTIPSNIDSISSENKTVDNSEQTDDKHDIYATTMSTDKSTDGATLPTSGIKHTSDDGSSSGDDTFSHISTVGHIIDDVTSTYEENSEDSVTAQSVSPAREKIEEQHISQGLSEESAESEEDNKLMDLTTAKPSVSITPTIDTSEKDQKVAGTSAEVDDVEDKVDTTTIVISLDEKLLTEASMDNQDKLYGEAEISTTLGISSESDNKKEESTKFEDATSQKPIQEQDQEISTSPTIDDNPDEIQKVLAEEESTITDSPMLIIEDISAYTTTKPSAQEDIRLQSNAKSEEKQIGDSAASQEPSLDIKGVSEEQVKTSTVKSFVEPTAAAEMPHEMLPVTIPGEGDCLSDQKTYKNNSIVPISDECEIACKCVSSIIVCERVKCDIPENIEKCTLDKVSVSKCCPTYNCSIDSASEDSVESIEEDATPSKIVTQQNSEESGMNNFNTTTIKPIYDGISIPEIEMPVAITEEPMSHVKAEEEVDQQTISSPIKTIPEEKKDMVTEDHSSSTPADAIEQGIVTQATTPNETSKQKEHETVTEKVPDKTLEKGGTPEVPITEEGPGKKFEDQSIPSYNPDESATDTLKPLESGTQSSISTSLEDSTYKNLGQTSSLTHPTEVEEIKDGYHEPESQTIQPILSDELSTTIPGYEIRMSTVSTEYDDKNTSDYNKETFDATNTAALSKDSSAESEINDTTAVPLTDNLESKSSTQSEFVDTSPDSTTAAPVAEETYDLPFEKEDHKTKDDKDLVRTTDTITSEQEIEASTIRIEHVTTSGDEILEDTVSLIIDSAEEQTSEESVTPSPETFQINQSDSKINILPIGDSNIIPTPEEVDQENKEEFYTTSATIYNENTSTHSTTSISESISVSPSDVKELEEEKIIKDFASVTDITTGQPSMDVEMEHSKLPTKKPALDLFENVSEESMESEEEISSAPTTISHLDEFITQQMKENEEEEGSGGEGEGSGEEGEGSGEEGEESDEKGKGSGKEGEGSGKEIDKIEAPTDKPLMLEGVAETTGKYEYNDLPNDKIFGEDSSRIPTAVTAMLPEDISIYELEKEDEELNQSSEQPKENKVTTTQYEKSENVTEHSTVKPYLPFDETEQTASKYPTDSKEPATATDKRLENEESIVSATQSSVPYADTDSTTIQSLTKSDEPKEIETSTANLDINKVPQVPTDELKPNQGEVLEEEIDSSSAKHSQLEFGTNIPPFETVSMIASTTSKHSADNVDVTTEPETLKMDDATVKSEVLADDLVITQVPTTIKDQNIGVDGTTDHSTKVVSQYFTEQPLSERQSENKYKEFSTELPVIEEAPDTEILLNAEQSEKNVSDEITTKVDSDANTSTDKLPAKDIKLDEETTELPVDSHVPTQHSPSVSTEIEIVRLPESSTDLPMDSDLLYKKLPDQSTVLPRVEVSSVKSLEQDSLMEQSTSLPIDTAAEMDGKISPVESLRPDSELPTKTIHPEDEEFMEQSTSLPIDTATELVDEVYTAKSLEQEYELPTKTINPEDEKLIEHITSVPIDTATELDSEVSTFESLGQDSELPTETIHPEDEKFMEQSTSVPIDAATGLVAEMSTVKSLEQDSEPPTKIINPEDEKLIEPITSVPIDTATELDGEVSPIASLGQDSELPTKTINPGDEKLIEPTTSVPLDTDAKLDGEVSPIESLGQDSEMPTKTINPEDEKLIEPITSVPIDTATELDGEVSPIESLGKDSELPTETIHPEDEKFMEQSTSLPIETATELDGEVSPVKSMEQDSELPTKKINPEDETLMEHITSMPIDTATESDGEVSPIESLGKDSELPTKTIHPEDDKLMEQHTNLPIETATELDGEVSPVETLEQDSELPTKTMHNEDEKFIEHSTSAPIGTATELDGEVSPVESLGQDSELPTKTINPEDEKFMEQSTNLPVETATELDVEVSPVESLGQDSELPTETIHPEDEKFMEQSTNVPTDAATGLVAEMSTVKSLEQDSEPPTKTINPEDEKLVEPITSVPIDTATELDGEVSPIESLGKDSKLPTETIHPEEEKLIDHITTVPTDAATELDDEVSPVESLGQDSELPTKTINPEDEKLIAPITNVPIDTATELDGEVSPIESLGKDSELPTETIHPEDEKFMEQSTNLPIDTATELDSEVSPVETLEQDSELSTKTIHDEDEKSIEHSTSAPIGTATELDGEVSPVESLGQDSELPTKTINPEDEKFMEQSTNLPVETATELDVEVSSVNLQKDLEQPIRPMYSEGALQLEQSTILPLNEHVTELPTKDSISEEEIYEQPTELPVSADISRDNLQSLDEKQMEQSSDIHKDGHTSSDKLPSNITELPAKNIESEEVYESSTKLPERVTESPYKNIESEEGLYEESTGKLPESSSNNIKTTELPIVDHHPPTSGETIEQVTDQPAHIEGSHEGISTAGPVDINEVKLHSATTQHPLFSHHITLPSLHTVSRNDNTVPHSTSVPEKNEIFTTTTTTTVSKTTSEPIATSAPHYQPQPPIYGQPPQYGPTQYEDEYTDEEEGEVFGPGTCRYGGKLYVSAQQIPRDDPCDFCFCFRSDIICLQQSCPPPIAGCHEEPISGFCCPRYECPVSMATVLNITTSTTTTSTTLPPHFLHHAYGHNIQRNGCLINGRSYRIGEKIESTSGPCINCTCGGDGKMKCDPQACVPEPTMQQVMAVVAAGRKR